MSVSRFTEFDLAFPHPCQRLHLLAGRMRILFPVAGWVGDILLDIGIVAVTESLLCQIGGLRQGHCEESSRFFSVIFQNDLL